MRSSMQTRWTGLTLAGLGALALSAPVRAQKVGYFTDFTPGDAGPVGAITANGLTPVAINDITTFDFASAQIVLIDTVPGGLSLELQNRESDLAAFVQNGGSLIINDASATDSGLLPGGAGVSLVPLGAFDPNASIVNVETASLLTDGPFGHLTGADLSGGNSSVNGYADAATLPVGAVSLLSDGAGAAQSVAFSYGYGAGSVLYTTVPLDFYFSDPFANDPPKTNFVTIFAPNELALAAVPEPGTVALLACLSMSGLTLARRRSHRAS